MHRSSDGTEADEKKRDREPAVHPFRFTLGSSNLTCIVVPALGDDGIERIATTHVCEHANVAPSAFA